MSDTTHAGRTTIVDDASIEPEGPHVLVAYATKYGSTLEIAERIARTMRDAGVRVSLRCADARLAAGGYDAVILGSAVFNGRWLAEADAFVARDVHALAERPVWLFSVGTFSDRKPLLGSLMQREPKNIGELLDKIGPREYRVFAGVIDRRQWQRAARVLFHLLGGRFGDNRNWADIDQWARAIAVQLGSRSGSTTDAATTHARSVRSMRQTFTHDDMYVRAPEQRQAELELRVERCGAALRDSAGRDPSIGRELDGASSLLAQVRAELARLLADDAGGG